MEKNLSIISIKNELMDAFLGDMRIINSFVDKDVKKATDYIGKNIFSNLNIPDMLYIDTFINFDVTKNNNCYNVFIITRTHKDLLGKGAVNRLDLLSDYIEEIVNELYPYNSYYTDIPEYTTEPVVKRQIKFMLRPHDKELYEREFVEKND